MKFCGDLNEDDLIDPRDYFKSENQPSKRQKKALQVARQVFETLQYCLTDGDDPQLDLLEVVSVEPAPDSRRFRVTVSVGEQESVDRKALKELLEKETGRLRSEIARSVHRKKTPQIFFEVI